MSNLAMIERLEREATAFECAVKKAHLAAVVPKRDAEDLATFLREVAATLRSSQADGA